MSGPELGCSAMPAKLVRAIHRGRGAPGRRVEEYLPLSLPWSWLFPPRRTHSPLEWSRRRDLSTLHPRAIFGSEFDTGALAPSEWGAVNVATPNPTVLEAYRWHRVIAGLTELVAAMDIEEFTEWRAADSVAGATGMWSRAATWWDGMSDTFEGLTDLPFHARALLTAPDRGPDREEVLAGIGRELGGEQVNVMLTELPIGEPQNSTLSLWPPVP